MSGTIDMRYQLARGDFALDVELALSMRGITGIFGPSGSGKTSLLRCIAGLEAPQNARLVVNGNSWEDSGAGTRRPAHERRVAYVFQEPRLFPHLDVRGNLEYARKRADGGNAPDFETIVGLLDLETLLPRRTSSLSGGEAQRVAIARALLRAPRFLLMDEPVTALDMARRGDILPMIERLHASLDIPVLYVSHDIDEVCLLCDQLVVMQEGRVHASGNLQDVLTQTDVPGLGGDEAGSVLRGTATAFDDEYALTRVAVDAGEVLVAGRIDGELRLRVRAADVSLCREPATASSILNVLPVTVRELREESASSALVSLALGGDTLLARITRRSVAELGLAVGDSLYAQIKSVSVRRASL